MEPKKTIFDYLSQVLVIFGFTILVINIFCYIFGNSAKDFSSMFALGNQGIPLAVVFEFLCVSALIAGVRFVFFTDVLIRKMPLWLRMVCMLTCRLYHCISMVSGDNVAAVDHVLSLFWNIIPRKLSRDDSQRKDRKQTHGRSVAKIKRSGGKLTWNMLLLLRIFRLVSEKNRF